MQFMARQSCLPWEYQTSKAKPISKQSDKLEGDEMKEETALGLVAPRMASGD